MLLRSYAWMHPVLHSSDASFTKDSFVRVSKCCTGLGYQYENGMCNINRIQNCCRIIRVYVADELCFHLECIVLLCPVLKCKIHCTRTEVTSADTDLNNCCKLLAGCVCDLTGMYFVCKISNLLLLLYIESYACLHRQPQQHLQAVRVSDDEVPDASLLC